ncbi:transposase [Mesorhizobium sp. M1396]|uniref:transposase n=1 Tax=Mesorhizobium sp. M1396 TaxID=2957095 RepID=UPI00333CE9CE
MWQPVAFMLTGGQVADCRRARYFSDRCQKPVSSMPTRATIATPSAARSVNGQLRQHPAQGQSHLENCCSPFLYRDRNAIERMFCRLKDFRRIATRYDRLETNFLATVCIAATVSFWL